MKVPFLDAGRQARALQPELEAAFRRVLESGRYLYGPELEGFEGELAAWFGVKHAVGVASGTDAVELALRAVGVGPGDSVACPAFTAVPCANAIEAGGATIKLVDIREDGNVSEADFIPPVRAVLAVSMFGLPVEPATYGHAPIVEDIAHAMGARHSMTGMDPNGPLAGTVGDAGAVSFYPSKCMGALGDGGAVITRNDEIARRVRALRHYGFDGDNVCMRGQNSRLGEIQAALLRVKLPHVHAWNDRRRAIAKRYFDELIERVGVQWCEGSSYHVYAIRYQGRDRLKTALAEAGIGTQIHYPRAIHQHDRWRHLGFDGQFPESERLAAECLSLPCYPELTDEEQTAVIAAVKAAT